MEKAAQHPEKHRRGVKREDGSEATEGTTKAKAQTNCLVQLTGAPYSML